MAAILTENSIAGDLLVFDDIIKKAYREAASMDPMNLLRKMVKDGVIQIDALFEQAISRVGKLDRESTEGRDFVDGSDAKKATTTWLREEGKKTRRVAHITNIEGKHGDLRIIVAETLTKKIYYFLVPKRAYRDLRRISIYFNEYGHPLDGKWFAYEVSSFDDLCE